MSWRRRPSAGAGGRSGGHRLAGLLVTGRGGGPMAMIGRRQHAVRRRASACSASRERGTTAASPRPPRRRATPSRPTTWRCSRRSASSTGCPGCILAGIGKVESDDGRSNLPGVHSGQNGFGAAGPMQIGIGGASGNTWGGAPVHPAAEAVSGVATDDNGDGVASVYDPADAIAGRGQVPARARRAEQRQRRHLRLQPPPVLRPGGAELGGHLRRGGYTVSNGHHGAARRSASTSVQTATVPNQAGRHRDRLRPASSSASPTCGAAPGRTRSTAPGW